MKLRTILNEIQMSQETNDVFLVLSDDFHVISKINQIKSGSTLQKIFNQFHRNHKINLENIDWDLVLNKLKSESKEVDADIEMNKNKPSKIYQRH